MVVEQSNIDHIMRGLQSTEGVRLHNHRKKLRQRFDIIKKLGQGTYGKVQLGINKETGQEVAIKTIKKCKIETEADLIRIRREIQIMSSVRHPNIIHIYEVFENREKMVLVMEYAAGGELYDFLNERKVLQETEARRIFRQISTAVYYCHKHKICHRDLKLENILLDEHGAAKIADFGLSNVYEDKRLLQTFCGSPLYASPEIVRGTPYKGPEVDCWSLGVLLYTLVYGAMPFDGSNFKRLVKQISNGDYFEPKKPKASPASPLIKDMLTVDPTKRASIEQICSHWWVNEGFNVSCLDIAEDLANQTPVRLDLLLSLAPPPENSDNLVVTDDQGAMSSQEPPPRSMSVGSILDLNSGQEDRRLELLEDKVVKRKLETAPSETSMTKSSPKKKESRCEIADQAEALSDGATALPTETAPESHETEDVAGARCKVALPSSSAMEVDPEVTNPPSIPAPAVEATTANQKSLPEGAKTPSPTKSNSAISSDKPTRKSVKTVKKKVTKDGTEVKKKKTVTPPEDASTSEVEKPIKKESRASEPREEVGKEIKREGSTKKTRGSLKLNLKKERESSEPPGTPDEGPNKPTERRKSKIFETAEKFMAPEPKSPTVEKPKKVFIPGVKVSDFAKAFERKSSITTSTPPVLKSSPSKKAVPREESKTEPKEGTPVEDNKISSSPPSETITSPIVEPTMTPINDENLTKMKDSARNVIANALVEEERKKLKKQILKPPVPRTKPEENANIDNRKKSLTLQIGNEKATVELHSPENTRFLFDPDKNVSEAGKENIEESKEKKTAKVNITLKSNTLPRRTSKAEIQLASPNYRTEVEHRVGDNQRGFRTQRSEVAFPVCAAQKPVRALSLEPQRKSKERIIPIQMEEKADEARDQVPSLERQESASRGRPPLMPYQRTLSQRSSSLSRQSTQDSDTESTMSASASADPIKKSPREFIIPIAVEGGGYVTPRATSLEPSESMSKRRPFPRRISLLSDNGSEDEGSSWRHDFDEPFRLHRLRSSRTARADSLSGSDDDEDDGFEILTAENLFSSLLSRVQSLTQRLNVEHGGRPGFPTPRLPGQRLFSGLHEPLTRLSERSMSRDMDESGWPRGPDVSHSIRSVSRDRSRGRHNENDMESVGGSRRLRSGINSRPRSLREEVDRSRPITYRSLSDASNAPSAFVRARPTREVSKVESDILSSAQTTEEQPGLGIKGNEEKETTPKHVRSQSDSTTTENNQDFYNILAEKYGIVPMRRYDLEPRRRRSHSRESKGESSGTKDPQTTPSEGHNFSRSPSNAKKEPTPSDKYQTPSEKLAAVLSQLESTYDKDDKKINPKDVRGIPNDLLYPKKEKTKKNITEFLKVENDRLKDLSPKALELYEKTLGLYQRSLSGKDKKINKDMDNRNKKFNKDSDSFGEELTQNRKSKIDDLIAIDKVGNSTENLKLENESKENSPSISKKDKLIRRLSRELESEISIKDDGVVRRKPSELYKQDDKLLKRLSKELEKEIEKEKPGVKKLTQMSVEKEMSAPPENTKPTTRTKIFNSLERKLEKLRPANDKKYIDKAIRSLRENSVGPKEEVSESFLIKRAVSLSECSENKPPPGAIQSTVNSVLGFFKKIDRPENQITITRDNLIESSPPLLTPESSPTKEAKSESSPKKDFTYESPLNRHSLQSRNNSMSFNDSSSFVSPDSESFDSWSNCSDFGTPDELLPISKPMSPIMRNYDEMPSESVGERIRRKSFYSRFNERRKSRKNVDERKKKEGERNETQSYTRSTTQNIEKARSPQPYVRSSTTTDYSRKWYDDSKPRPFYKSEIASKSETPFRKTSLDWSRTLSPPTFMRSHSQCSTVSSPNTSNLPRPQPGSYDSLRRPPIDSRRPFSPTRLVTPGRAFSPSSPSPTFD